MELNSFLPEGSLLKRGSFKRWNDDENSTRLVLSIPHGVSAVWGTREVEGRSDLKYVLQSTYTSPKVSESLVVSPVTLIGNQSTDLLRGLVDALRPKMSHNISDTSTGAFDLRAVCFTLGSVVGASASGSYLRLDGPCPVRLLSPGWTVPSASEMTIAPGVANTPREFASLLAILGTSGVSVAQLMYDSVPSISSRVLTGNDLGAYALRLAMVMLSSAQSVGCADHHIVAFFRGMCHSVKLWSHSDEGGWIREALRMATYPPSCGVVSIVMDSFLGLSTRNSLASGYVPKTFLCFYLKMVGILVRSDPCPSGGVTVLKVVGTGPPRPSSVEGLGFNFEGLMRRFRHKLAEEFDLHLSGVGDTHSYSRYFERDKVDDHLRGPYVIPFWWVEPSALSTVDDADYPLPAVLGKSKKLDLCPSATVYKGSHVPEVGGRVFGGCRVIVKQEVVDLRMSGMSYIMSGAYNSSNGLGRCQYVCRPDLGTFTTDASFVPAGVTGAVERRWITPHNPMPNPVEGKCSYPLTFSYTYSGVGKEPTLEDWKNGSVNSGLGLFTVDKSVNTAKERTHRYVPEYLSSYLNKFNSERPLVDAELLSEYVAEASPEPIGVEEQAPADVPLDVSEEKEQIVKTVTLSDKDPAPGEYAEEVNIRMHHSSGARPDQKKAPVQDESPPGSDPSAPTERAE